MDETITVSKNKYSVLLKNSEFLACLISCGVENYECWDNALEMIHDLDGDD